jgi:hypothetical protein
MLYCPHPAGVAFDGVDFAGFIPYAHETVS